jgi:glycosyltransferase involved in cell wall biosynthesis
VKILHVVPTYMPAWRYGGPIRSVHGLCRGLAARGNDVHVYTTSVDGPRDLDVPLGQAVNLDGVEVRYFPSPWLRRLYWSPGMRTALHAAIGGFDILHLHSVFLWPTWVAARIAGRIGIPYVVTPRGALVRNLVQRKSRLAKTAWIRLIERRTLERAAAVHVTSDLEGQELSRFGFKLSNVVTIPNAIDETVPMVATEATKSKLISTFQNGDYVLYMGRISWEKGLDRLIPAMVQVSSMRLVIAGSDDAGYRRTLEELVKRLGVSDRVVFVGQVNGIEKESLLTHARILVLPSYSENFGNAVLEAMNAGCPVVVTPEVGVAHVVKESGAGLVVAGEPSRLAEAVEHIAHDDVLRRKMGEAGRRAVAERYTWRIVAAQMEEAYERVLANVYRKRIRGLTT